jgi:hypothetical protein
MSSRTCLAVAAAAVVAAAAPGAAGAVGFAGGPPRLAEGSHSTVATAARLRRPSGTYTGPGGLQIIVQGKTLQLVAFGFKCRGKVTGRTALNDFPIVRRRGRYRFSIKAHGGVTYSDDKSPDNAAISFSGRFTPKARRALGTFTVRTPRCGRVGPVAWSARRR